MKRADGRAPDELRKVEIELGFTDNPAGSVLIRQGRTLVLCTATLEKAVPAWLRGSGRGWVTAEYSLLPGSTDTRTEREAAKGKQTGRTQEIQRLIGRSLRAVIDLAALGERTVTLDCDVLQADGGTRTAAITGSYVALADACDALLARRLISASPLHGQVAAVSVGICSGVPVLDLSLDATHYFDIHHTINDTLAKIDPKLLDQSVAAFAVTAWLASTKQGDFGRAATQAPAASGH